MDNTLEMKQADSTDRVAGPTMSKRMLELLFGEDSDEVRERYPEKGE